MGPEPFDLDERPPASGTGAQDGPGAPGRGPLRPGPVTQVLVLLVTGATAATTAAAVTRERSVERERAAERSRAVLVVTRGELVAARSAPPPAASSGDHPSEVVLAVEVVDAGPRAVRLVSVSADGDASALHDTLAGQPPLPAAATRRVLLYGRVSCRTGHQASTRSGEVVVRAADGSRHVRSLPGPVLSSLSAGMQRACALPVATP